MKLKKIANLMYGLVCASLCTGGPIHAIELSGLVDLRVVATDAERSWTRDGLDKTRFDRSSGTVKLGQAFLRANAELLDMVTATVVASAGDDRGGGVDITEAWIGWNPVPRGPWKARVKVGSFFPATNLEIDYDSIGWTPVRTLSSSAINSWMGEELRINGVEASLRRKGHSQGSSHDIGFTAAVFKGNDPTGTLLAWRGWSLSDRITGLKEPIRLADLPVYGPGGALEAQDRSIHVFREIDNRPGYYFGAHYGYDGWLSVDAMHYDNRGDPLVLKQGQYSWHTRFDHLSARMHFGDKWVLLFQGLRGETAMGPNAVRLRFDAWYAMASRPLGPGNLTLRYDRFRVREQSTDLLPTDPNSEKGRALALAYLWPVNESISLVSEALVVRSSRVARTLIGEPIGKTERSLVAAIRWHF